MLPALAQNQPVMTGSIRSYNGRGALQFDRIGVQGPMVCNPQLRIRCRQLTRLAILHTSHRLVSRCIGGSTSAHRLAQALLRDTHELRAAVNDASQCWLTRSHCSRADRQLHGLQAHLQWLTCLQPLKAHATANMWSTSGLWGMSVSNGLY